jgi:DNA adenine methylase
MAPSSRVPKQSVVSSNSEIGLSLIFGSNTVNMARAAVAETPAQNGSVHARRPVKYELNRRRLVGRAAQRREKMIAFGYYGGKFSHLDFILPLLPTSYQHYCEPFGGSAAVLINRKPAAVETYNDIDSEVANFFACLRDDAEELVRQISLTPFSREELVRAHRNERGLTAIERARRFFVRARQTRTGLAQTSSEGRWAHCVLTSRAGMAGAVSRWLGSVEGLSEIVQRLQRVQIESVPAIEVIRRYDSPDTLFYCDPPYPHESRGDSKAYGFEMTNIEHEALARVLRKVEGAVAVSGYRCELMDRLYGDWVRVDSPEHICNSSKTSRVESVWMNYAQPLLESGPDSDASPRLLEKKAKKSRVRRNGKK